MGATQPQASSMWSTGAQETRNSLCPPSKAHGEQSPVNTSTSDIGLQRWKRAYFCCLKPVCATGCSNPGTLLLLPLSDSGEAVSCVLLSGHCQVTVQELQVAPSMHQVPDAEESELEKPRFKCIQKVQRPSVISSSLPEGQVSRCPCFPLPGNLLTRGA